MWDPLSQLPPQGYMHTMTGGQQNPALPPVAVPGTPVPPIPGNNGGGPGGNPVGPGGGSGQHLPGGMRDPMNPLDPRNLRRLTMGMDANALAAFMQQFQAGNETTPSWLADRLGERLDQHVRPQEPAPTGPPAWDMPRVQDPRTSALLPYAPSSLRQPW